MGDVDELLTIEQAAARLRVHIETARRYARAGEFRDEAGNDVAIFRGRSYLIPASAIATFFKRGAGVKPPQTGKPRTPKPAKRTRRSNSS